jgi:thiamine pyrophosphate-dependent acetolactate synthase large subunit-like protein
VALIAINQEMVVAEAMAADAQARLTGKFTVALCFCSM